MTLKVEWNLCENGKVAKSIPLELTEEMLNSSLHLPAGREETIDEIFDLMKMQAKRVTQYCDDIFYQGLRFTCLDLLTNLGGLYEAMNKKDDWYLHISMDQKNSRLVCFVCPENGDSSILY